VSDTSRLLIDQLRSQLATIQRDVDVLGRDIRVALHHGETARLDFQRLEHARASVSAALMVAFDEFEKLDTLLAGTEATQKVAPPSPPPGGEHER
jgi:hypothetical protein